MSRFRELAHALLTKDVDEEPTDAHLAQILAWIAAQDEWRFFVDGTRHLGHQAATVSLMKRLIHRTKYSGAITIVHTDSDKVKPGSTASKLALLLTGIDPRNLDETTIAYGTCRRIRFLDYSKRGSLRGEKAVGFTGAADDMSINLATELKVRHFVRLQPYLWDDDATRRDDPYYETSRVEHADGACTYLVDAYPPFRQLAYKVPRELYERVPDEVWTWYGETQSFDAELKTRTNNARALYSACRANPRLQLWPVYGLHHFVDQLSEMALSILLSACQARQTLGKPIVIVVFNGKSYGAACEALLRPFAEDVNNAGYDLRRCRATLAKAFEHDPSGDTRCSPAHLDAFVEAIAHLARPWIDDGVRLSVIAGHDEDGGYIDISGSVTRTLEQAATTEVVVVLLGPVPVDVFNNFYATCQVPGVFEGQASSSLVISLGRPFLQVIRQAEVIHDNYPPAVGSERYEHIAQQARSAALQLTTHRYRDYLRTDAPRAPMEYVSGLSSVSDFICDAQDPASPLSRYFGRLGSYYQQDVHDKLLLGLLALADAPRASRLP